MKATQKLARDTFTEGQAIGDSIGTLGSSMWHDLRGSFCLPPHVDLSREIPAVLEILQRDARPGTLGAVETVGGVMHLCLWQAKADGIRRASRRLVRAELALSILAQCSGVIPGIAAVAFGILTVPPELMREAGEAVVADCAEGSLYITPSKTTLGNLTPADIRFKS